MTNLVNDAINSVESDTKEVKSRGTRPHFFACIALINGKIAYEMVEESSKDRAIAAFTDTHGVAPSICDAGECGCGYFVVKGLNGASDRVSISVRPEQLARTTSKAFKGQFSGWNVFASGLAGFNVTDGGKTIAKYEDNELVSISFDSRIDPSLKVKKPIMKKQEVLRLEDLENVQELSV